MTSSPYQPEKVAAAWGLTLHDCVAETPRARIYKVDGPQGACALKLYKEIGFAGEGAAVQFLRALQPDIGVKIYRSSFWRAAVLMEWLDGPTLRELADRGEETRAIADLCTIAAAVKDTGFTRRFTYRRLVPKYQNHFAQALKGEDIPDALPRAVTLFDQLVQTTQAEHVIHGDLNLGNIILTTNGPRLIDPKGLRADPALEFTKTLMVSINNDTLDFAPKLDRYAAIMGPAIGATPQRLIQWTAVDMAMSIFRPRRGKRYNAGRVPLLNTLLDLADR